MLQDHCQYSCTSGLFFRGGFCDILDILCTCAFLFPVAINVFVLDEVEVLFFGCAFVLYLWVHFNLCFEDKTVWCW